ncbi:MAG: hypothetical protein OXH99_22875, partial [Bryobacterales bacterium]|nr:hypothetical protein [Bryobacterales bacterium]
MEYVPRNIFHIEAVGQTALEQRALEHGRHIDIALAEGERGVGNDPGRVVQEKCAEACYALRKPCARE